MVQADEGGPAQRIAADEQPAVRLIANIFMALFTLDVASLRRDFDLYGGRQEDRWIIGLKPRAKAIAGVFSQATITGAEDVEQVVLIDAQGDRTVIDLSDITYSSDAARRRRARLVRACTAMTMAAPLRLRFIAWGVLMLALLAVFALRVLPNPQIETDILALLPQAETDRSSTRRSMNFPRSSRAGRSS